MFRVHTLSLLLLSWTIAAPGCERPSGAEETSPRDVEVGAAEYAFSPGRIVAGPGEPLAITLRNDGDEPHRVAFELPGGTRAQTQAIAPGATGRLTLRAPEAAGEYAFFCEEGDHRERGMVGTLEVLARPQVALQEAVRGLTAPVAVAFPEDGTGRWFVADQVGLVFVVRGEEREAVPLLDLRDRMVALHAAYDERGLLGLALHPEFADNGRLYVYYSAPLGPEGPKGYDHTARLSEFTISPESPDRADPGSERVILAIDQPQANHNGGTVAFGPDGMLYLSVGDGGGIGDAGPGHPGEGNGQSLETLLGKILRVDVDGGEPYAVPPDNPFVDKPGADEIYAYGFRNPYRFSFDQGGEGALFVGDAGEMRWEEVSVVEKGQNMGWNVREGTHCFDSTRPMAAPASCPEVGAGGERLVPPVIELANAKNGGPGLVLIGGHVYRGAALPELAGRYVFGMWAATEAAPSGLLFYAVPHEGELWSTQRIEVSGQEDGDIGHFLLGIGQAPDGELLVLTSDRPGPAGDTGRVFRVRAAP